MEHFRSSGTSGGLLHSRTRSAYVKQAASEFLRAVGMADAESIATGRVSDASLQRLLGCARHVVSESWLSRQAGDEPVRRFTRVASTEHPEEIDRAISEVIRHRFPDETARPELNSRWG